MVTPATFFVIFLNVVFSVLTGTQAGSTSFLSIPAIIPHLQQPEDLGIVTHFVHSWMAERAAFRRLFGMIILSSTRIMPRRFVSLYLSSGTLFKLLVSIHISESIQPGSSLIPFMGFLQFSMNSNFPCGHCPLVCSWRCSFLTILFMLL